MAALKQLAKKKAGILEEIAGLGPMRKGSLCKRMLRRKTDSGEIRTRGPYWYYTFKRKNKTVCKMVGDEKAARFQEQIEEFRRFQALTKQYGEVSQGLADLAAKETPGKKNS